jgi:phosphate:Na+ symporter
MGPVSALDWIPLVVGLVGGLALLLFGLGELTSSLRAVAGDSLRVLLARLTDRRPTAVLTGAFATAVVQSSTATTVLVVGFVGAGLMTFPGSLGVLLGSNVGTTVTAQVVAFDIAEWALAIVAVGFAATVAARSMKGQGWGTAVIGLGLVFLGMQAMAGALSPLRTHPPFVELLAGVGGPLLGVVAGTLVTALIQSSSATTVLAVVLASQGLLTLEAGIGVVIGANIGTCLTAAVVAVGKSRDAQRAAAAHILFNLVGGVVWLVLIGQLAALATWVSPSRPDLDGAARLAAEVPRQLANAHTIFNVGTVLGFFWFLGPVERLIRRLLPDRREVEPPPGEPRYLAVDLLPTPALALEAAGREVRRLGELVLDMLTAAPRAVLSGTREELRALRAADDDVDDLYASIVDYLAHIPEGGLSEADGRRLMVLLDVANTLESVADLVETNLVQLGIRRLDAGLRPSDSTEELLGSLFDTVTITVADAVTAVVDGDDDAEGRVLGGRRDLNRRLGAARTRQADRLRGSPRQRGRLYAIEIDVIDLIKRIEYLARHMVRTAQVG